MNNSSHGQKFNKKYGFPRENLFPEQKIDDYHPKLLNQQGKTEKRKLMPLNDRNNHYSSEMKNKNYSRISKTGSVFPAKSTFKENQRAPKDLGGYRF